MFTIHDVLFWFVQSLCWLIGRGRVVRLLKLIIRLITKPFYYLLELTSFCENDKNSYQESLRQAECLDWLDSL